MNYKKIFKRETTVIAYVVIAFTLVVIGVSYALFLQVDNNTNNQEVYAGSLKITYAPGADNTIDLSGSNANNCLIPQSDDEGSGNGGCKFTLSITNEGTLPMEYSLLIYNNVAELPSGGTMVDHSLIKHTLNKQYKSPAESSPTTISSAVPLNSNTLQAYNKDASKTVLESAVINVGETIEFSLKLWISEDATTDIIGQYVYLKLDVVGSVFEGELQPLTTFMSTNSLREIDVNEDVPTIESNENNIENNNVDNNINTENTDENVVNTDTDSTSSTDVFNIEKEYRYVEENPDNYVYFNCTETSTDSCELWRILGVYNVSDGTNVKNRIKLIQASSDLEMAWDEASGTTFNSSSIYTYLNNEYYNGLSESAKAQIGTMNYAVGGANTLQLNPELMYGYELKSTVSSKVGLMSVSDYGYASGLTGTETIDIVATKKNWLANDKAEWFINQNTDNQVYAKNIDGSITTGVTNEVKLIRPVIYLADGVKVVSGNGTISSPYILSK